MRYHALACDYDGTIAVHGIVDSETIRALESVRNSGRRLVLVTGRELDGLMQVFPRTDLFDRIVAENGALIYRPDKREERLLADAPPPEFARTLEASGIFPLSYGRVIVATHEPQETKVLEVIRDLGLELQVIFNKGAVMILPSGINKASGLLAALSDLGLSCHNTVAIGDAENDHAFLSVVECSVAVSDALESLKSHADHVTTGSAGAGVVELAGQLVQSDLRFLESRLRHRIALGVRLDGTPVTIRPYRTDLLIAGTSGAGKSSLSHTLIEKLEEKKYQFCVIDPEGDYSHVEGAVVLGDKSRAPTFHEVMDLLSKPSENAVLNLLGVPLKDRPAFFETLLHRLKELHGHTGRPHWLIADEAHHLLPVSRKMAEAALPEDAFSIATITVEPEKLPPTVLAAAQLVIAIGDDPNGTLEAFGRAIDHPQPSRLPVSLRPGEGIGWFWKGNADPFWFRSFSSKVERRRHRRKYAEGELEPNLCFYFRGPENKLRLKAQNLSVFLQIAEGLDDETWLYHLRNGHFAQWFQDVIKDPELAAETRKLENGEISGAESRARIRSELEERYILAA